MLSLLKTIRTTNILRVCLLLGFTRAGRPLHMQVSLADTDLVKIVTLYEPDGGEWVDYSVRR